VDVAVPITVVVPLYQMGHAIERTIAERSLCNHVQAVP